MKEIEYRLIEVEAVNYTLHLVLSTQMSSLKYITILHG